MSQTCNNLATKAELEALAAELDALLESKVDNVEKASIINVSAQQGLGLAASLLLPKIAKALAGLGILAAKVTAIAASIAFLVAQVAALALLQYQINRNKQRINSNSRTIERNTARTLDNRDKTARNAAELTRQKAEIDTLRTQMSQARREISNNDRAIASNERAINRNNQDIARNQAAITQSEIRTQIEIDRAQASLRRQINSAETNLQRQISAANADLQRQVNAVNSLIQTLRAGYQASIADVRSRLVSQIQSISITLARSQGQITELQVRLALATGNAAITSRRVQQNENEIGRERTRRVPIGTTTNISQPLQDLGRSINNTRTGVSINTGNITNSNTRIRDLNSRVTALETTQMDTAQRTRLRRDISSDTQTIIAATIGTALLPQFNELRRQTSPTAISSATNNALCQQANNPSSCLNTRVTNPIQRNLGNIVNGIGATASTANTAINTNILNRVTDIQNKVNNSQFGLQATKQFLNTAWSSTRIDKILNAMNTALALHNALMLSRNLGSSIGEVASSLLNAIGVRDSDDNEINVNEIVTNRVRSVVDSVIGAQNTEAVINSFNSANRILTAAQGVVGSVRGIKEALQNGQEIIANRVGFIGNSFLEQGILEEDSFRWMNPNLNLRNPFSGLTQSISNLQEFVDETNELVQTGIEVQENFGEIVSNIEEFSEARSELEQNLEDFNTERQEESDQAEVTNASPEISNSDLVKDED